MIKVLEQSKKNTKRNFDSLIVEIPKDFAAAHGLPEKSFATLTVREGKITSEIISYSDADEREIESFLADFPELDAETRKIGD